MKLHEFAIELLWRSPTPSLMTSSGEACQEFEQMSDEVAFVLAKELSQSRKWETQFFGCVSFAHKSG